MVGMGMVCAPMQYQELEQSQTLSHSQKLQLKLLQELSIELQDPTIPNAARGLDGMIAADEILKERNSTGILIGGLSESVWNQRRKKNYLYNNHKDVDVLVNDPNFNLERKFEGDVDWWTSIKDTFDVKGEHSDLRNWTQTYHKNGNGVVLGFEGGILAADMSPGLYIPSTDFVKDMRMKEIRSNIYSKHRGVEIDDEVLDKFENSIRKRMGTRLPKFIRERFDGQILSHPYMDEWKAGMSIYIKEISPEVLGKINS